MKQLLSRALGVLGLLALVACQSPLNTTTGPDNASARALATGFAGDVTLQSRANGKFVGVDAAQAGQLTATLSSAEVFTLVPQAGGKYALKAKSNGLYVSADLNKAGALVADRPAAQGWEFFTLEPKGGDTYALKADSNGKYVSADLDKATKLIADRALAQGWELFTVVATETGGGGGGGGSGVTGVYSKKDDWGNGYNGQFTLTNPTSTAVSNWTVTFDAPTVAAVYNANWTQVGGKVTITPKAGTAGASIAAGASVSDVIFTVYNSVVQPTNIVVTGGVATKPVAPTGVVAAGGNRSVNLSWASVAGASSYNVYWSNSPLLTPSSGTKVSTGMSPFTQTGLTNGSTYYYVVTAVNSAGESAASPVAGATPTAVFTWNSPAQGLVINGSQTNGTVTAQKSGAWDALIPGQAGMKVVNNTWGIPQNGNGTVSIFTGDVEGTPTFGWSWNLNATSSNQVIAYPEIGWGWSPNASDWFNGPTPLNRISDNKSYKVDFNIKRTNRSGIWNTAFDIWIYPMDKPTGGSGGFKNGYELMIWLDHEVQGPWGSNPQSVTLNGSNWTAYDNDGSAGWKVLTYINAGAPINDARGFDLNAFLNDICSRYGVPRTDFINAIEFGSESCGGQGMLEVANYKLTIQ